MIDIDECKEILKALKDGYIEIIDIETHRKATCKALEKQIPTTPDDFDDCTAYCPICGNEFEIGYEQYSYCPNCGQALDWSGEDE